MKVPKEKLEKRSLMFNVKYKYLEQLAIENINRNERKNMSLESFPTMLFMYI